MCGTTVLDAIGQKVATQTVTPLLAVGVVMILAGLAFNIAAAPFHFWAPDAYEGSPAPTVAFIASGSKVAAFLLLGRILLVAFGSLQGSSAWHGFVAGWSPLLALVAALAIFLISLAGLPPLAGFFGKFYLFAMVMRDPGMVWLVAIGLAGSLVSLYYYLVVVRTMFVDSAPSEVTTIETGWTEKLLLSLLGAVILLLGLFPNLLLSRIEASL